jgi:hypothetical protein
MVSLLPRFAEFAAALTQLANEHDVQDSRYVNHTDLRALRDAVKAIDPDRLVTASSRELSAEEKLDFYSQHLERGPDCAAKTERLAKQIIAAMPTRAPLHFQEPFRRDYSPAWNPQAADFYQDLAGAKGGGAAGWCFHNGDNRHAKNGVPHRSFNMTAAAGGSLWAQWDTVEREVIANWTAEFTPAVRNTLKSDDIPAKKNVVFMVMDDARPDLNYAYGQTFMHTPNMDRLAKSGMVFRHAYSQFAVCGPSRSE